MAYELLLKTTQTNQLNKSPVNRGGSMQTLPRTTLLKDIPVVPLLFSDWECMPVTWGYPHGLLEMKEDAGWMMVNVLRRRAFSRFLRKSDLLPS